MTPGDAVGLTALASALIGPPLYAAWLLHQTDRPSQPQCAHCCRRIRSGLTLTGTDGPRTRHWHGDRPKCRTAAEASDRQARHPHGDAPAGVCPICGQHDPDHLDAAGCHESCVDWLGYVPRPALERQAATAERTRRRSRMQEDCGHVRVEHLMVEGGHMIRICWTCKALRAQRAAAERELIWEQNRRWPTTTAR